jgi:hypothetical protein
MPTIIVLYAAAIVFVFLGSISEYIFVLLAFFFAYHFVKSMNFASFCGSHVTHIFAKNETWQMTWWRQLLHVGCMYVQSMSFVLCLWIKTIIQTGQLDQTIGLSNKYRQTNVSWHVIGCVFLKNPVDSYLFTPLRKQTCNPKIMNYDYTVSWEIRSG